jgi:hypothetical protein
MLFGLFGAGVEAGRKYSVVFGRRIDRGAAPPRKPQTERQKRRAAKRSTAKARREERQHVRRFGKPKVAATPPSG